MTSASIAASGVRNGGLLRMALEAWRGITWEQLLAAFFFGNGVFVLETLIGLSRVVAADNPVARLGRGFAVAQIMACTLLLGLVVANRVADSGASRRFAYLLAVLASTAAGTGVEWLLKNYVFGTFAAVAATPGGNPNWIYTEPIENFVSWLLIGGFGGFIYAERRLAAQTMARLRGSQIARLDAARTVAESRLQEMQARVEPQFLLDTLAEVARLYAHDERRAERMLDALIGYLRAAMPSLHDASSTLARELALVRGYLTIAQLRSGGELTVEIDGPETEPAIRLPAMMLQPIVGHALLRLDPSRQPATMRIAAHVDADRVRIVVAYAGAARLPVAESAAIAGVRNRLAALYGDRAALVLDADTSSGGKAVLELPYEQGATPDFQ